MELPFTVFVIHSFEDMTLIKKINEGFKQFSRVKLLVAEWEKRPGELLVDKVTELMQMCHVIIVVWSHNLERSIMANQEIGFAHALNKKIFPFVAQGMSPKGLLEGKEYIEYDPFNVGKDIESLVGEVTRLANLLGYHV